MFGILDVYEIHITFCAHRRHGAHRSGLLKAGRIYRDESGGERAGQYGVEFDHNRIVYDEYEYRYGHEYRHERCIGGSK